METTARALKSCLAPGGQGIYQTESRRAAERPRRLCAACMAASLALCDADTHESRAAAAASSWARARSRSSRDEGVVAGASAARATRRGPGRGGKRRGGCAGARARGAGREDEAVKPDPIKSRSPLSVLPCSRGGVFAGRATLLLTPCCRETTLGAASRLGGTKFRARNTGMDVNRLWTTFAKHSTRLSEVDSAPWSGAHGPKAARRSRR